MALADGWTGSLPAFLTRLRVLDDAVTTLARQRTASASTPTSTPTTTGPAGHDREHEKE